MAPSLSLQLTCLDRREAGPRVPPAKTQAGKSYQKSNEFTEIENNYSRTGGGAAVGQGRGSGLVTASSRGCSGRRPTPRAAGSPRPGRSPQASQPQAPSVRPCPAAQRPAEEPGSLPSLPCARPQPAVVLMARGAQHRGLGAQVAGRLQAAPTMVSASGQPAPRPGGSRQQPRVASEPEPGSAPSGRSAAPSRCHHSVEVLDVGPSIKGQCVQVPCRLLHQPRLPVEPEKPPGHRQA